MTVQSRSLSETHPTFYAALMKTKIFGNREARVNNKMLIQSCTVDLAEHNKVQDDLIDALNDNRRLQKELGELKSNPIAYWYKQGKEYGLVDGERLAMERVKEVIECERSMWLNDFNSGVFNKASAASYALESLRHVQEKLDIGFDREVV